MLLVALTAGRAHPLILRALKLARHRRARSLSITDATLSDVTEHSEMLLYYSSNGPSYIRSNAALMGLVQALAHGVYSLDEEQTLDQFLGFEYGSCCWALRIVTRRFVSSRTGAEV